MTFGTSDRTGRPLQPRRRSRARTLIPLAVAAWAVLEIWLLVEVAGRIGGGWVLLILLAGLVLGGLAVKHAGRRAWNSLAATLRTAQNAPGGPGAPPGQEPVTPPAPSVPPVPAKGAGTEMLGGLLLMIPGLVSDAVGLLCLFPPTRKLLSAVAGRLARRFGGPGHPAGSFGDAFQQARMRMPDGKVVPGEVVRDEHRPPGEGDDGPRPPLTR